jgi:hypothetical protein
MFYNFDILNESNDVFYKRHFRSFNISLPVCYDPLHPQVFHSAAIQVFWGCDKILLRP